MARLFSRVRHDIEGADPNHNRLSPPDAPPGAGGGPATQGDGGPVKPLKPPAVDELESRIRALEAQLRAANTTTISEGAVTHMTNSDHHLGDRVTAATVSETDREADVETDEEDRDVAGHGDPQGTSRIAAAAKTFAKDSSIHAASLAPMPSLPHLAREQDASPDLTIPSLTASVTAKLFDTMLTRINDKGVRVPSYPPDQNHLDHYDQLRALRHIAPPAATEDAGLHPIIDWGFTAWVLLDDAKSARANDSATEASERRAAARRSDPKSILTPTRADTHIIHPHAITTARGDQARLPTPAHSELRSQPAFRVRGLYVRAYGQLRVTPARSHAIPRRLASRGFGDDARLSHSVINHQTFTTNICPIRDTQVPKQMDPHTRGEPPRATTEDCTQAN